MNKDTGKLLLLSAGVFGLLVLANMTAEALYTNSKIGVDKKNLYWTMGSGVILTIFLMKQFKKS
jgi:hypothetical protein